MLALLLPIATGLTIPTAASFSASRAPLLASRASPLRMDDIVQTRQSDVVESDREDFVCEFEIPKKVMATPPFPHLTRLLHLGSCQHVRLPQLTLPSYDMSLSTHGIHVRLRASRSMERLR